MVQNATTGALPAVVTIPDLPTGTTITGAELLEAVQTVGGVGNSIQITINQIATTALGALPTGGGTGQILDKVSGANFSTQWADISSLVTASTGLAESGSTTIALSLASTAGLSVLGVAAVASAVPSALAGTAAQVLVVNDAGTGMGFGRVNLASSAAVTGVLPGINMTAVNLAAPGAGGVQGVLPVPNGGTNTTTLTAFGVLFGNGTSAIGATAAGTAGWPLVGNGSAVAPAFAVLTVPGGGSGTTTLTAHGVLLGAGTSTLGIAAAGTSGFVLAGNGTTSDPSFQNINTLVVTNVTTGFGLTGGTITTTGQVSISTTSPPFGFTVAVNLGLTASTAGSALTISAVTNALTTATATSPILVPFRDATLATGDSVWRAITTTNVITINQTATLGAASGSPMRAWITAHDTGTSAILGVINCLVGMPNPTQIVALAPHTLQSTIAIASTAITAGIFYAPSAVASKPFTVLGYFEYANMTTAGQWINTPTQLQLFGPGIKKPGEQVQILCLTTTSIGSTTGTAFIVSNITGAITPSSAANIVQINAVGEYAAGATGAILQAKFRRGTTLDIGVGGQSSVNNGQLTTLVNMSVLMDAPATTSATTYAVYFSTATVGSTVIFPQSGIGPQTGAITLTEIMA